LAKYAYNENAIYPLKTGKEEENALDGKPLDDPSLQVKIVRSLRYPGKNLAKDSV
jgi:hypothetical protein